MEFTDNLGRPSIVVDSSSAGQRLQRFASHAFREQLGRTANGLHSNAAHAAHATPCLVDGERRPGRWELRAGELVTLELGAAADDDAPPPQRGSRPRMALRDEAGALGKRLGAQSAAEMSRGAHVKAAKATRVRYDNVRRKAIQMMGGWERGHGASGRGRGRGGPDEEE